MRHCNDEEKKIGTNRETNGGKNVGKVFAGIFTLGIANAVGMSAAGCKADYELDKYTLPIPAGWGTDGYPINEELKNAF